MKKQICLVLMCSITGLLWGSELVIRGRVTEKDRITAIETAVVAIGDLQLWAVTNERGEFVIKNVPAGTHKCVVSCLGYVKKEHPISISCCDTTIQIILEQDNLALNEVVITAKENKHVTATAYVIDKTALEHQQLNNVNALSSLLPGGKTQTNNLATSDKRFEIRAATGELGNPSFMTAVEVDGIRLSNNASFSETAGADTRNIPGSNIESVEVITGIPSAEYGDVSGGVVKIKTQKGKAPFKAILSASPRNHMLAVSQGIDLKAQRGTLNLSLERSGSFAEPASPHTNYTRNAFNAIYSNTFGKGGTTPLSFSAIFAGNIGGYDSEADPDAFAETYTKQKDHTLRGALEMNWLINKPFITGMELKTSLRYANKQQKINTNKSSSTSTAVFHGTEEGYFVATDYDTDPDAAVSLIPAGYWYQLQYTDDRPLDYNASLKLYHNVNVGRISNKLKMGVEFSMLGNLGDGVYYDQPQYTPTWRPYAYSDVPFMKNAALYAEDEMRFPIGTTRMQLSAGIRYDRTQIDGSEYGAVSAFSPRLSMIYTLIDRPQARFLRNLRLRGGFGDAVKLPSFAILYSEPNYKQQLTFAPGALSDGTAYYAYYIQPTRQLFNPNLKWQSTRQSEIGVDLQLGQVKLALNAYRNKSSNGYMTASYYTPFAYKFTDQRAIEGSSVPVNDRVFSVNRQTGVVTLSDRTGQHAAVELPYAERTTFKSESYATNNTPVLRQGIEWIADFGKIPALFTNFRLDGSYYHYKGVNETVIAGLPTSSQSMANGLPYKYVGYYAGSTTASNGSETRRLNTNLTLATHIPRLRLLFSLRIESTLYQASRYLSEYNGKSLGVVLNDRTEYTGTSTDIYGGDRYVAVYPLYYTSADDMNVKIPFEEKFLWAKEHDKALYNELSKLVAKTNTAYFFNENRISPYFSANLSITKEIGKRFSLSFYANNFLNSLSKVTSSWNDSETTLYNSGRISSFDYGMTLRVKL
ncbi:MAG: TonB-dependent receptor [Bacteroidales bacterium]